MEDGVQRQHPHPQRAPTTTARTGFLITVGSTGNTVQQSVAHNNAMYDAVDQNPAEANTWLANDFGKTDIGKASANLIANSGAEAGPGGDGTGVIVPPGWTTSGNFTVVDYVLGGPLEFPGLASPGPLDRGANFFSGGPPNASSSAWQTMSLTGYAGEIDHGTVIYVLTGWLGGYDGQDDNAGCSPSPFQDVNGVSLGAATRSGLCSRPTAATSRRVSPTAGKKGRSPSARGKFSFGS